MTESYKKQSIVLTEKVNFREFNNRMGLLNVGKVNGVVVALLVGVHMVKLVKRQKVTLDKGNNFSGF